MNIFSMGWIADKKYYWDDQSAARDYANYKGKGGKDKWKSPLQIVSNQMDMVCSIWGNVWE